MHVPVSITYYDLIPYRDLMSIEQLERYGDYLLFTTPEKPFTHEELQFLQRKKDIHILRLRINNALKDCKSVKLQLDKSRKESWDLAIKSQLKSPWRYGH